MRRDLWLFGLALAVRLAGWLWLVGSGVQPFLDEDYYFKIAGGWSDVLRRLAHLSLPTASMLTRAWGEARWPPLHPFVLGMARVVPTDDLSTARLVGVVAGSLTTLLVVRLTARLAGQPAARAAGTLHALYPSFVFFSVSLWSETLFILLLLAFLLMVVRAVDSQAEPPFGWIPFLGCGSALLLLTRSAALPMVVGLLAWLALRLPRGRRLRTVAGATLVVVLLVLPWSVVSSRRAGQLVILSSSDARNLAFGNNPWTPPELGSSWGVHESRRLMLEGQGDRRYADIARREILGHPLRTAQRIVVRAMQLAGLDFFPLRNLANATLPPLPAWALPAGLVLQWLSLALLLFLAVVGLCGPDPVRHRPLLLTLVVAGAAGPLASIAMSRLALPLLAVLLPAAGCGWAKLRQQSSALRPAALTIMAAASLLLPVALVRQVVQYHLEPSSHYAPALAPIARAVGAAPFYSDVLACRPPDEADALRRVAQLAPEAAHWVGEESTEEELRGPRGPIRYFAIGGSSLERPIALVTRPDGGEVGVTEPERWQRFLPVPGTTLTCAWAILPRYSR
jgi:4-amino-4-deoxy-L-arabinose transferase-like glycosyltransferase